MGTHAAHAFLHGTLIMEPAVAEAKQGQLLGKHSCGVASKNLGPPTQQQGVGLGDLRVDGQQVGIGDAIRLFDRVASREVVQG